MNYKKYEYKYHYIVYLKIPSKIYLTNIIL